MNCSPQKGGLGWCRSALVTIEGSEAFAKFGGGGQGDVPTVRGAAIIPDGGSAIWTIKVVKKFRAGAPMRVGVQKPEVEIGQNWSDMECISKAWYLDSNGEMYDGKNIINETEEQIKTGDELKVQLAERTLTFFIGDKMLPGKISNVVGEVQLAVQLFTKGDRVNLTDQEVGDAAEAQVAFETEDGQQPVTVADIQIFKDPPEIQSSMERDEEEQDQGLEANTESTPSVEEKEPAATPTNRKMGLCGCC